MAQHLPHEGEIVKGMAAKKTPEDAILEAMEKMPSFNWKKAWEEVQEERRQSER